MSDSKLLLNLQECDTKVSDIKTKLEKAQFKLDDDTEITKSKKLNTLVEDTPELINSSPYDDGWIVTIESDESIDSNDFLSANQYNFFNFITTLYSLGLKDVKKSLDLN